MPIIEMPDLIQNGLARSVELMAVAAHNSFRFNDRNTIRMRAIDGDDLEQIAEYCFSLGDMSPLAARDGRHLVQLMKEPCSLLLIGDKRKSDFNYNCGACGYRTCAEMNAAEEVESLISRGRHEHVVGAIDVFEILHAPRIGFTNRHDPSMRRFRLASQGLWVRCRGLCTQREEECRVGRMASCSLRW
jgi:hypothetical protein